MASENYLTDGQVIVGALQALILVWQIIYARRQVAQKNKQDSTYECDSLYFEITKLMIEHKDLIDFYKGAHPGWNRMTLREKRMYLLAELNYFHLAFVHREYKKNRVDNDYWELYRSWMEKLMRSNAAVRTVHDLNKGLFETEFGREVDKLRKRKSFPENRGKRAQRRN